LYCYKQVSLEVMCMVKAEEKYFKTKYRAVDMLQKCLHYDLF